MDSWWELFLVNPLLWDLFDEDFNGAIPKNIPVLGMGKCSCRESQSPFQESRDWDQGWKDREWLEKGRFRWILGRNSGILHSWARALSIPEGGNGIPEPRDSSAGRMGLIPRNSQDFPMGLKFGIELGIHQPCLALLLPIPQ